MTSRASLSLYPKKAPPTRIIPQMSISGERVRKIAEPGKTTPRSAMASSDRMQKLASKFRVAMGAVMGGFGRVALKPFYQILVRKGGAWSERLENSLWWLAAALLGLGLRQNSSVEVISLRRIGSDTMGMGECASDSPSGRCVIKLPISTAGSAGHQPRRSAREQTACIIYASEIAHSFSTNASGQKEQ